MESLLEVDFREARLQRQQQQ